MAEEEDTKRAVTAMLLGTGNAADGGDEEGDSMWPLKREERLIELYRDARELYDMTAEGYQKRNKKDTAYTRFSGVLGVPVSAIEKRLRTLRTAYTKQRKVPSSGSGRTLTERNRWIVDRLAFLRCHVKSRARKSRTRKNLKDPEVCRGDDSDSEELTAFSSSTGVSDSQKSPTHTCPTGNIHRKRNGREAVEDQDCGNTKPSKIQKNSAVINKSTGNGQGLSQADIGAMLSERTQLFRRITELIALQHKLADEPKDPDLMWAQLLCAKIKKMPEDIQEDFKLHVDRIALGAIRGSWRANVSPTKVAMAAPSRPLRSHGHEDCSPLFGHTP